MAIQGLKALWARRDGKPALIVAGIVAIAFLWWGLPAMIAFATNLLHFGLLCGAAIILFWIITDNDLRTKAWYIYKALIRAIFSFFIKMDPVSILKSHVEYLKKQLKSFVQSLTELRAQLKLVQREVDGLTAQMSDLEDKAKFLRKTDAIQAAALAARIPRLSEARSRNSQRIGKLKFLIEMFEKVRKANEMKISQVEFEIEQTVREYEVGTTTNALIKSASGILFGNSAARDMYEQANNELQSRIALEQGAFDEFLSQSEPLLKDMDTDQAMFEEKGKKLLEQWDNEMLSKLGITENSVAAAMAPAGAEVVDKKYAKILS
jgi:phage shock protein A